jgi:hypothetical protein
MRSVLNLFRSFLPPRYREERPHSPSDNLLKAAGLSAYLELMICVAFYVKGLVNYTEQAVIGPVAFLEYFSTPKAWLLLFLGVDGAFRLLASLCGQVLGTSPLYLVAWIHGRLDRRAERKRLGPLIVDLVERGVGPGFELCISSCRPRRDWDQWMTVLYEERLYEIASEKSGSPPRPYIYHLRLKPEWKVIRGLHRYEPNEVLNFED